MGDKPLIPKTDDSTEPFGQRWGLHAGYLLDIPFSTSISEEGLGHGAFLHLDIADSFVTRFPIQVGYRWAETEGKLLPSTSSEGTTFKRKHWGLFFGLGTTNRVVPFFDSSNDFAGSLSFGIMPTIGGGSTTIFNSPLSLEDESFGFGSTSDSTVDASTTYSLTGEIRPWERWPVLTLGPAFNYGVQYAGENSEYNRVNMSVLLMLSAGYGDASAKASGDADTEQGLYAVFVYLYGTTQGLMQRYWMNKALADPQQKLVDYGLLDESSGGRGSMTDVPLFQAGSTFASGLGDPYGPALHTNMGLFWALFGARTLGEGLFLSADSDATKTGATAGLLSSVRELGYPIAGIETPKKRLALADATVEHREMVINMASYLLNSVFVVGGGAGGSDIVMQAGASANVQLALNSNPTGRGTVERTDVSFVPAAFQWGGKSGMRPGVLIHKSWHDFPSPTFQLFTSALLLSPGIYGDAELNSDVDAALGLEWKTPYTRLSIGLNTKSVSGGGEKAKAGIGGIAGFDLLVPFNGKEDGSGLTAGIRFLATKLFPEGHQLDLVPSLGATVHY